MDEISGHESNYRQMKDFKYHYSAIVSPLTATIFALLYHW
jgi:hypothetical protein